MEYIRSFKKRNYIKLPNNYNKTKTRKSQCKKNYYIIIILIFFACTLFFLINKFIKINNRTNAKNNINTNINSNLISKEKIYYDLYEVNKYNAIKDKIISHDCSEMWANQREFLNGVVRKFKPKKITMNHHESPQITPEINLNYTEFILFVLSIKHLC